MTIDSADVLSSHLKPLCPRDNHVMKYESGGSRANTGDHASHVYPMCLSKYLSIPLYYYLRLI
jgi:hypothetical protein